MSSYQGSINWSSVAGAGISFAYIRAGDGTWADPTFQTNWNGAHANGITAGAYLFYEPSLDPNAQANLLISQLQSVTFGSGSIVPAIDVETMDGQSAATVVQNLQTTVNDIQSAMGVLPAIYTSPSWWNGNIGSSNFTADPLWVACWCSGTSPSLPANNWGGFGWQVWQYTSSGSVAGISGRVDLDQGNPGPPLFTSASTTSINGPTNARLGQPVTATATVSTTQAGGHVTFSDNGVATSGCANLALSAGKASCTWTVQPGGVQQVAAAYSTGSGYFSSAAGYTMAVQTTAWPPTIGAPATAQLASGSFVAYWRGTNNHLWETWTAPDGSWATPVDWTAQWGAPALASAPSLTVNSDQQELVFWQGANNDLWEAWDTPVMGWSGPVDWSAQAGGGGTVASTPSVMQTASGQTLVFWQGSNHDLYEAWYTPGAGWNGPIDWSAKVGGAGTLASAPNLTANALGQTIVFWQGTNHDLFEAWYTPGTGWSGATDWTAAWHSTATLASRPSVAETPAGQTLLFWQGTDNHLWEAWYTPGSGWRGPADWTAQWNSSGTLGSAPNLSIAPNGQDLVFWQGTNNHLWQAWYTAGSGWGGPVDWTAQWGGKGLLAVVPDIAFMPAQTALFWQDPDNHMWEAVYAGSWSGPVDWSAATS